MLNYIYSFHLSLYTLAGLMFLPFFYFIIHIKYWYNFRFLLRFDIFLKFVSLLVTVIICIKAFKVFQRNSSTDLVVLYGLHLLLPLLTLLSISYQRIVMHLVAKYANEVQPTQSDNNYVPMPVNNAIEHLTWNDIIISDALKQELASVSALLRNPNESLKYGIEVPKGILFMGPPGTGKTTIAKVMAHEAGMNFFVLSVDEVVSKWVGESEKNLTRLFNAAKMAAPAIIFIDEVDSIGRGRGSGSDTYADNLLNHLLQLIDGVVKTNGLYIIAATNRADLVDDALKRSGRLNKVIEIPLPDYISRVRLFELFLKKLTLSENIDIATLANITEGKSGADIKAICQQAGVNAFKREAGLRKKTYVVTPQDIEMALREFVR